MCDYCGDSHIFKYCHKGIQSIRFMKSEDLLYSCSMNQLRWLCKYYKIKISHRKKLMIDQLLELNKKADLYQCPICLDELSTERTVITPCGHAFCDYCILKFMQKKDECPICRSHFTIIYLLLVIPKDRIMEIYGEIYSISMGEPVYYCQQIMGERLHPNGYVFDQEDITHEINRNHGIQFCRNHFIFMVVTLLFIQYIISCLNEMLYIVEYNTETGIYA